MEQNNNNISNDEDISPVLNTLDRFRDRMDPYVRYIMIVGMLILIFLVVFLGYARGALDICNDLGGRLDWKLQCHPSYYNQTQGLPMGNTIIVPNFTIENGKGNS